MRLIRHCRSSARAVKVLLRTEGWPRVERVLQTIDAVETLGIDPADVAPDYWRHIHNRLSVNETPRAYTYMRHQAWLQATRDWLMTRLAATLATVDFQQHAWHVGFRRSAEDGDLECQRQRTDRPLCRAAGWEYRRCRISSHCAAAADRAVPRRTWISAERRADDEARSGAARTNRLPQGLDIMVYDATVGRARDARQRRSQAAGLAGLPHYRRRRTLPHELGCRRTASTVGTSARFRAVRSSAARCPC